MGYIDAEQVKRARRRPPERVRPVSPGDPRGAGRLDERDPDPLAGRRPHRAPDLPRRPRLFPRDLERRAVTAPAGLPTEFAQDNLSCSKPGVLRGLHYQFPTGARQAGRRGAGRGLRRGGRHPGRLADVRPVGWGDALGRERPAALHPRRGSPTGSSSPATCPAIFSYKCTTGYDPNGQCSILWDDPDLAIEWPGGSPHALAQGRRGPEAPRRPRIAPAAILLKGT